MNNTELEKLLKSVPPPERPPEFWEQLARRVSTRIHRQAKLGTAPGSEPRGWWSSWTWGFSAAAACLVIAFALGNWRGTKQPGGLLQNEKVVREVLAMFPNQVQAIVQDENGLRLSLADKPDVPISTPFWIKVCDGKHCRSFITFSGQTVQIAGQRVEVLADAQGKVMLLGDRFFWSSADVAPRDHLRIDVRQLIHVL